MEGRSSSWELANAAAKAAGVSLVPLEGLDEAVAVSDLVVRLWGERELSPPLIRAFQHAGTALYGAEENGRVVGFVLGFVGLDDGLHMHSHMLGVLPECQSRGIGFALKLAQRAACLDAGIEEVRWTYDPLVARNGRFNLVKLGAVAIALLPGFYGEMTDRINRGDRSDRFEVLWPLTSHRVKQALSGTAVPPREGPVVLETKGDPDAPTPMVTGASPEPGAVVAIPTDYFSLRMRDPGLASSWREASAEAFASCFGAGMVAMWICRDGRYIFGQAAEAAP